MKIKNVICDIDGVLLHDNTPVPGADLFLARIQEQGMPLVVLTNYPSQTAQDLANRFELPPGFSDQTLNSGIINDNTSTIQRFLDGKSRQSAVSSEVIPPDDMKLNTSDKMLKELAQSAITVLAERYQNIQTTKEENFTVGKQKFRRVDTEQTVNGQKVVSTLVLTVFNKRVVTLQMLSPAKTPEVHQALVQRIIDTLAVK